MPHRLRPALGLAVALLALLLSGCGTTGTPSATVHAKVSASSPQALPTKASFIAQAQAICRALSAQEAPLKTRQESLKGLPNAAADSAFVSLARHVVALSQAANGKLQALARPPGDASAISELVRNFSQDATYVADIAEAAVKQESTGGEDAEDLLKRSLARDSRLADAYGMQDCFGSE